MHLKASGSSEEPSPAGSKSDVDASQSQQTDEHQGKMQTDVMQEADCCRHLAWRIS